MGEDDNGDDEDEEDDNDEEEDDNNRGDATAPLDIVPSPMAVPPIVALEVIAIEEEDELEEVVLE
jgi:hypothetical protein